MRVARARAREEEFADRLFLEFWAKYPKECPRKVGKKKCRAKYALLMRNAKDSTALHVFDLVVKNGTNREESICELAARDKHGKKEAKERYSRNLEEILKFFQAQ